MLANDVNEGNGGPRQRHSILSELLAILSGCVLSPLKCPVVHFSLIRLRRFCYITLLKYLLQPVGKLSIVVWSFINNLRT